MSFASIIVLITYYLAWCKKSIGGSKTIKSKLDGRKMDRDINGARGIFLRALADTP